VIYTYQVGEDLSQADATSVEDYVFAVQLGCRNVLISSLVNVTNGGSSEVLSSNLEAWTKAVEEQCAFGKCLLNATPLNNSPYDSGLWISWGSNGLGVSSVCVRFNLTVVGRENQVKLNQLVNITTTLKIEGTFQQLTGISKRVNVTSKILNEGEPALANAFAVYYYDGSSWLSASSFDLTDYGNGTYLMSFVADIAGANVEVSVRATDNRQILVQANTTCTEI